MAGIKDKHLHMKFLLKRVAKTNGCWLWTGTDNGKGYGLLIHKKVIHMAHRFFYEYYVKNIPNGKVLDHLCRVRNCVNPKHLEVVTNKENILRGICPHAINSRKIFCYRGHRFSEENLVYEKRGRRRCKTCNRENAEKYRRMRGASRHPSRDKPKILYSRKESK